MRPVTASAARQTGGHFNSEQRLHRDERCAKPGNGEDPSTCRVGTNGRRIDRGSWGSLAQELTRCDASIVQGAARGGICLEDDAVLDLDAPAHAHQAGGSARYHRLPRELQVVGVLARASTAFLPCTCCRGQRRKCASTAVEALAHNSAEASAAFHHSQWF